MPHAVPIPLRIAALLLSGLVLLPGCQNDEIRRYQVPRVEAALPPAAADRPARRMLAAIVPKGDEVWFFKLDGPVAEIEPLAAPFEQLLRSVKFTGNAAEPITWTNPAGWERKPGSGMRYATLTINGTNGPLELTVTKLGKEAAEVLPNVNRWRGQLGLSDITAAELPQLTRTLNIQGAVATVVDLTGVGSAATASPQGKPAGPLPARPSASRPALHYDQPAGWQEVPPSSSIIAAAFKVVEGGQTVDVTVTPLSGTAGGLLANVNRWRGQIGAEPVTEAQLARDVSRLEVGGTAAEYVDITGPAAEGKPAQRMLVVLLPRDGSTWFFKLWGPAELVARQKSAFEAFVKSVRFGGGTGGPP